ncbi:hypothetical protein ACFL30_00930 [Candidatus Latescibacterota bacterium]
MINSRDDDIIARLMELERRIEELSTRIEKQTDMFLDEDLKARGIK